VLDVAARTDLKPPTAGVLAVTRQLMASVALLHDFAPYGFHGALGPERLILAREGRIVVAEHVLGTLVEEAAAEWGVTRLWHDFRLAVLPEPKASQYGRRVDVVQVGLTTLAMLLGRPLGASDYPHGVAGLVGQVEERTPEGTRMPLRSPLRGWLERTLALGGDSSFRTLLEAQKSFGQMLQDEDYGASSAAWEAFVGACETAASRVPVVAVSQDQEPPAEVVSPVVVAATLAPAAAAVPSPAVAVQAEPNHRGPSAGLLAQAEPAADSGLRGLPAELSHAATTATAGSAAGDDAVARLKEDPFGPWPVATPTGSAATLLDAFEVPAGRQSAAAALADMSVTAAADARRPAPALWTDPSTAAPASAPAPKPETTVRSAAPPPGPPGRAPPPPQPVHSAPRPWEEPKAPAPTSVADWGNRTSGQDLTFVSGAQGRRHDDFEADEFAGRTRTGSLADAPRPPGAPDRPVPAGRGSGRVRTLRVEGGVRRPPGPWHPVGGERAGGSHHHRGRPGARHTPPNCRSGREHLLEVQSGGSAKSKTVTVGANQKISERMTFPEAGERGGLMITTYPSKGKITVDGVPRGDAPVKVTDLSPGTHTLLVETSFGEQEQDVVVQSGRVSQLSVPTVSWIKVTAPFELTVYENGG